jgi:hypothetical protein
MSSDYRIDFCKICKNRSFNFNEGIICKLTNEKPSFEENCPSFDKDEREASNQLESKKAKKWEFDPTVYTTKRIGEIIPENREEVQFKNSKDYFGSKSTRYFAILLILLFLYTRGVSETNLWAWYLIIGVCTILFILHLIKFLDNRPILTFTLKGIKTKKEFIGWFKIKEAYIEIIKHRRGPDSEFFILRLINGEEKKYNVTSLNVAAKVIGGVFEYFFQNVKNEK